MSDEMNLREGLLGAEPLSSGRQQRFREELARIVDPPLGRGHRLYYLMSMIGLVVGMPGALCGFLFDPAHRWTWGLMLLWTSAFAGWIFFILRRGAEPLRIMQGMSKALAGISVMASGLVIYQALKNPTLAGVLWALAGVLFSLLMCFINLWNCVIASERTVRENVLRIEYRLADLASRLPPPGKP